MIVKEKSVHYIFYASRERASLFIWPTHVLENIARVLCLERLDVGGRLPSNINGHQCFSVRVRVRQTLSD